MIKYEYPRDYWKKYQEDLSERILNEKGMISVRQACLAEKKLQIKLAEMRKDAEEDIKNFKNSSESNK